MPADIVSYGGWLAALIIAAHITVRLVAPYADPVLLPIVAALNGLGLAVIHRLDLALDTHFARQQLVWMTLGVGLFVAHPGDPARPPGAPALHLHLRSRRDRAAPAADGPGHRQDRQRRAHLDPRRLDELPARRGRQGAAGDHLRRLPRAPPRRARARRPPGRDGRPPARPRPRPDPGDVAGQPRHPGLPARPRLEPAVLRPLPDHAVRRDRAGRLARRRRRAVRRSAPTSTYLFIGHVRERFQLWSDVVGPLRRHHRRQGPADRRDDVRDGLRRPDRPRPRPGLPVADPVRRERLHLRRDRRGARADRRRSR